MSQTFSCLRLAFLGHLDVIGSFKLLLIATDYLLMLLIIASRCCKIVILFSLLQPRLLISINAFQKHWSTFGFSVAAPLFSATRYRVNGALNVPA